MGDHVIVKQWLLSYIYKHGISKLHIKCIKTWICLNLSDKANLINLNLSLISFSHPHNIQGTVLMRLSTSKQEVNPWFDNPIWQVFYPWARYFILIIQLLWEPTIKPSGNPLYPCCISASTSLSTGKINFRHQILVQSQQLVKYMFSVNNVPFDTDTLRPKFHLSVLSNIGYCYQNAIFPPASAILSDWNPIWDVHYIHVPVHQLLTVICKSLGPSGIFALTFVLSLL